MMQVWDDPEHWRKVAEEVRSEAERITNGRAKQMMLNIAETYGGMARRAQKSKEPPADERAAK
jgi:hypothetical protein